MSGLWWSLFLGCCVSSHRVPLLKTAIARWCCCAWFDMVWWEHSSGLTAGEWHVRGWAKWTPKWLRRHKDHKGCGLDKELRVSMDRPGSPKCDRLTSSPTILGKSKIEPTEFPDCKALLVDQNSCPSWNETWNMKPRKCPVWGFSTAISKRSIWAAAKPSKPAVRHSVYCTAILGGWEITMGYDKPWFSPIYWVYIYICISIYIYGYMVLYWIVQAPNSSPTNRVLACFCHWSFAVRLSASAEIRPRWSTRTTWGVRILGDVDIVF